MQVGTDSHHWTVHEGGNRYFCGAKCKAKLEAQPSRDWRSFGAFSAFLVALFTAMYGFPLAIYPLLPRRSKQFPGIDFLSHDAGHLLETLIGWRVNPHLDPLHLASAILLVACFNR